MEGDGAEASVADILAGGVRGQLGQVGLVQWVHPGELEAFSRYIEWLLERTSHDADLVCSQFVDNPPIFCRNHK